MPFDNNLDLNDTFYPALPEDKREEIQNSKLGNIAKPIDETAEKAVAEIENSDFIKINWMQQYKKQQKQKLKNIEMQKNGLKESSIKRIVTNDIKRLNDPK